jgi:hypothetical protein
MFASTFLLLIGGLSMSYAFVPTIRIKSQACLLAGGFGKSPVKKSSTSDPILPAVPVPPVDNIRYVTKKGSGACVVENHCSTFNLQYPSLYAIHSDPPMFEILDFFSTEMCDDYVKRSSEGTQIECQPLSPSKTTKRTSQTRYLEYNRAEEMINLAYSLTGIPMNRYEEPQVVRYLPGKYIYSRKCHVYIDM